MLVAESHRERLLRAMVRQVAERGYGQVSVADVVSEAGVSRSAFYEEFDGKDECLFEAYDGLIDGLIERIRGSFAPDDPWPVRVRLAVRALLDDLAAHPELARMATVDLPAAGPEAHRRYREAIERFLPFFEQGRAYSSRAEALPRDAELMAVGGAEAIVFDEVVAGRATTLPRLLPDILFALLVPYLGPEGAIEEMRRAQSDG
jgi:AcrR family transcriptional regulator